MIAREVSENTEELSSNCADISLQAWLTLMRVYEKMQRHAGDHLECYDLSPAQYDVLAHLHDAAGISQQELADRLMVTKGNVCTLLNRMEEKGFVVRENDPDDKRIHLLQLTDLGTQIARRAVPAYGQFVREHLAALSSEEQTTLRMLLGRIERLIENH
jgi:DNA-binding MarR family transcriptional regulator